MRELNSNKEIHREVIDDCITRGNELREAEIEKKIFA